MTRKLSITLTIILLLSFFVVTPVSAAKSYYAERFDVQIDIQENGSAVITETIEFHFSGDAFTFAFREVSAKNTEGNHFPGGPAPTAVWSPLVEAAYRTEKAVALS